MKLNKQQRAELTDMYEQYGESVKYVCSLYRKHLPGEELSDLTQYCWEAICRKYPDYEEDKAQLSTWVSLVSKSTLSNLIRELHRQKRAIRLYCISYEEYIENSER